MINYDEIKGNIYIFLLKRYIRNFFVALDQFLNTLLLGDEDETISSRLGKSQRGDFGLAHKSITYPFAKMVDFVALTIFKDKNHCASNIEESVGSNALLAIYFKYKSLKEKG